MNPGDPLIDNEQGETAFRPVELIEAGEHYQIARAVDEENERQVAVRAIVYDDDATDEYIARRRASLSRQWELMEVLAETRVTPEPIAYLELPESPVERPPEPVLVCELIDGPTLYDWVVDHYPEGLDPEGALAILADLTDWLTEVHAEKWLCRGFDPRRFRVEGADSEGQQIRVRRVSLHNASKWKEPLDKEQLAANHAYVAPEIRDEVSGKLQRPAADLYGLGALLSFLLTGEEPRHRVESPLSFDAYERVQSYELPGLEILLARLLQPLAKNRLSRAQLLRPYCSMDGLPTREERGFEMSMLPAPWLGVEIDDPETNRALRSKLSAGPLVSVAQDKEVEAEESSEEELEQEFNWPFLIVLVLITAIVVAMALLF